MANKLRKRLYKEEALSLGLKYREPIEGRKKSLYSLTPEQWEGVLIERTTPNKREFVNTLNKLDKNGQIVSSVEKLQSEPIPIPEDFELVRLSTSMTTGQQWAIHKQKEKEVKDFDFDKILEKHLEGIKEIKVTKVSQIKENDFDALTYTDVHIGMETDKYKKSMYPLKWDREEVLKSAELIISKVAENRTSDSLVIDDLGDLLDGYNAQTTRGGHSLPQNMTNEEAFDCALDFKITLLKGVLPLYQNIKVNNICNDNHAGSFGYFVNSAFKKYCKKAFPSVQVDNHLKFINHYYVGRICFIVTHGKDDSTLKFGFKPQLDTKSIEKIDQYCKHNNIYKNSELVIFKKGDSHQCLLDMCSSDDFFYFNYPALSPSSQWVQNNFKKGRKGFVLENFRNLENNFKTIFI